MLRGLIDGQLAGDIKHGYPPDASLFDVDVHDCPFLHLCVIAAGAKTTLMSLDNVARTFPSRRDSALGTRTHAPLYRARRSSGVLNCTRLLQDTRTARPDDRCEL